MRKLLKLLRFYWQTPLFAFYLLTLDHDAVAQHRADSGPPSQTDSRIRVQLTLAEQKLVLGTTNAVDLRVTVAADDQGPVDGCHLQMGTNVGSFSDIQPTADDKFKLKYILPTRFFPQYAIISATVNCNQGIGSHWTVVPLHGTGDVMVKSKPKNDIILRVGDETFGPVSTDRRGKALIPITVPPGFRYGRVGKQRISLNMPPVNRIAVSADRTAVTASTGTARIYIYAIDLKGSPLTKAELRVDAQKGTVEEIVEVENGVYQALYRAPQSKDIKKDTVTVRLKNAPASRAKIDLKIGSEIPTRILISSPEGGYRAGSDKPVALDVKIRDAKGNPTTGPLSIKTDFGSHDPIRLIETGWYRTQLRLPNHFGGKETVTVHATATAETDPSHKVKQTHEVSLNADTPSEILLRPLSRQKLPSDGKSRLILRVFLQDRFGNSVNDAKLAASAKRGTVLPITANGCSHYRLTYQAPLPPLFNRFPSRDMVQAGTADQQAELQTQHEISLSLREYRVAFELGVGYFNNFGNLHSPLFSIRSELSLWFLLGGLFVSIDASYFFDKEESDKLALSSALHGLPISAAFGYRMWVTHLLELFVQVGAGPLLVWYELDRPGVTHIKKTTAKASVSPSLGMGFRAGPGAVMATLSYRWVDSVSLPELKGALSGLGATVGYRYTF